MSRLGYDLSASERRLFDNLSQPERDLCRNLALQRLTGRRKERFFYHCVLVHLAREQRIVHAKFHVDFHLEEGSRLALFLCCHHFLFERLRRACLQPVLNRLRA